jgi:hypothetical protein
MDVKTRVDQEFFNTIKVLAAAGIKNVGNIKSRLDQAYIGTTDVWSGAGNRSYEITTVNEAGLYEVILDSRKPFARSPVATVLQAKHCCYWVNHFRGLYPHNYLNCHRLEALSIGERCWLCLF